MQKVILSLPIIGKFLSARPMLLRVVENISWLSLDKVIRMGVGLFVGVWVARYLGPAGYGMLNYAVAFVSLFSALATLGLDQIVVRELVHTPENEGKLVGTSFFLKLIGGILVLFLSTLTAFFIHKGDLKTILMIFFVSLGMVAQAFLAIDFFFQSKILSKYTVIAQNTAFFAVSLLKVLLILMSQSVEWFAIMSVFEAFIAGVFLVFFYNRKGGHISCWKFDIATAKKLLLDSWPLILSSVAITIYMRVDQVMIRNMLGEREVGWYSAAVSLTEVFWIIPGMIMNSIFPVLVQSKKESEQLYYDRLQWSYVIMLIMGLSIGIIVAISSTQIVKILYGKEFSPTANILKIYVLATIIIFWGAPTSKWSVIENLQKLSFSRTMIAAFVNVLLNFFLIPIWQGFGAALATVFAQFVSAIGINLFDKRTKKVTLIMLKSFPLMFNFKKIFLFWKFK